MDSSGATDQGTSEQKTATEREARPPEPAAPPQTRRTAPHFDSNAPEETRLDWMMERYCAAFEMKYDWRRQMCAPAEPPS